MSVLSFTRKQLLESMLTGVPQIIKVKGAFRKLVKSVVLILCVVGCTYQVWSFMEGFWTYPTNVNNIVSHPNSIEIPAFTICEYNGLRPSSFCSSFGHLCTPQKSYAKFCTDNYQFCFNGKKPTDPPANATKKIPAIPPKDLPTDMDNVRLRYGKIGVSSTKFIEDVTYKGDTLDPTLLQVFNPEGLPTNCFAYNVFWGNASAADRIVSSRNALEVLVRMTGELFYNSTPLALQMVVHSPFMKLNPFRDGFSVKPCTTYKMYLEKTQNFLLPAPYHTNCTDYQTVWRNRGGQGPLTKKMCVDECIFNKSIEMYGCFDPNEIDHPNDSALFCFEKKVDDRSIEDCEKSCQLACFDESIKVRIEEFESSITSNQKGKKKCLTKITISFVGTQLQKFVYTKKYEIIEAFGYVGGFLGMWLGLSLIAVCDFLETCLVILFYAAKRLRKRNKKTSIKNMKDKNMFIHYIKH